MKKLVVLALVLGATAMFGFSVLGHVDTAGIVAGSVSSWAG